MSTDYGEKERQFLETLKADTGRDVSEWMTVIAAEKLSTRNEIIDWLRRQGFMFSKASWLERIHNNGGRPIYANGGAARRPARPRRPQPPAPMPPAPPSAPVAPLPAAAVPPPPSAAPPARPALRIVPKPEPVEAPAKAAPPPPAPAPPAAETHDLDAVLAKAKAFRMLANYVLAEIAKVVPGSAATPGAAHVVLSKGTQTFAVLAVSAKELRLGLVLAGTPVETPYQGAKSASFPAEHGSALTHMAVLNDARQINDALLARVREAADRVG